MIYSSWNYYPSERREPLLQECTYAQGALSVDVSPTLLIYARLFSIWQVARMKPAPSFPISGKMDDRSFSAPQWLTNEKQHNEKHISGRRMEAAKFRPLASDRSLLRITENYKTTPQCIIVDAHTNAVVAIEQASIFVWDLDDTTDKPSRGYYRVRCKLLLGFTTTKCRASLGFMTRRFRDKILLFVGHPHGLAQRNANGYCAFCQKVLDKSSGYAIFLSKDFW